MRKQNYIIFILVSAISFAQNSAVRQFSKTFADVAEEANPSVVTIMTEKTYETRSFQEWTPFEDFFSPKDSPKRHYKSRAIGSGVIVDDENGYILTNNHVIDEADEVKVTLMDKRVFSADIIGKDPKSDLAVLKIDADDLSELKLGDSDRVRVGEWVLAVGSPFSTNLSHTVTAGIVSALGRSNVISNDHYENFIQTDAAINPGNSGGALLDLTGDLIGINTAIATGGFERSNRGVGFAIPSNMAKRVMEDLITKGYVVRSWLGVYIQEVDDKIAKAFELEKRDGALVSSIVDESPAEKAGFMEGDVIIRFDESEIRDPSHLKNVVSATKPGTKSRVKVVRKGKVKTIQVVLEELNTESQDFSGVGGKQYNSFGFSVQNISPLLAQKYNFDDDENGVVVTKVDPKSEAYEMGVREGDLIQRVGSDEVNSKKEFKKLVDSSKDDGAVLLLIKRDDVSRFYALDLRE
ncbi:MAG: protease [Candidatus Marinimicrobia bacterium]|nr:protease [Candidatus Neomarinimicrobiota bacterium]|tara:strand:+ start:9890 stop:11284 length:1395 start_codon:yes stop_codon:yes gene_type:complete